MRPDAYRWFAPKHANFLPPHERKAGFNPDQPRDELGQWTETGAEDEVDQSAESVSLDEFGSASRGQGHHFVARSVYRNLPLSPEAKTVFDKATTGPLSGQRHGFSEKHKIYNDAVAELFDEFTNGKGLSPQALTADQAREFVNQVKTSRDPRIRDFNIRILQREITHILRSRGRRPE